MPQANNYYNVPGRMEESSFAARAAIVMAPQHERNYLLHFEEKPKFLSQLSIFNMLDGGTFDTKQFIHLEGEGWSPVMTINAVSAPGPGASIVVTIAPGNYFSNGECMAEVGTYYRFPNGILGLCTAIGGAANARTMTLAVHNWDFQSYAAGTAIIRHGNSVGEAAGHKTGFVDHALSAYDHQDQKMKWGINVTDFGLQEGKSWVKVKPMPNPWTGGTMESWTDHQLDEKWDIIQWEMANVIMFNDRNHFTARTAGAANFTDGIMPVVKAQGVNLIAPAVHTIQWWRNTAKTFKDRSGGSLDRRVMCGSDFEYGVNTMLFALNQNGNNQQSRPTFDFGWNKVTGVGATFDIVPVQAFSDGRGLDAHGWGRKAVFLPPSSEMSDSYSDGQRIPKFRVKFFSGGISGVNGANGARSMANPFQYGEMRGLSFLGDGKYQQTLATDEFYGDISAHFATDIRNARSMGVAE